MHLQQCWSRNKRMNPQTHYFTQEYQLSILCELSLQNAQCVRVCYDLVTPNDHEWYFTCTACQFCGITLPGRLFGLTDDGILCLYQEGNMQRISLDPSTKFYGRPLLLFNPGQPFGGVLIHPVVPNAMCHICVDRIQQWAAAVSKLLSKIRMISSTLIMVAEIKLFPSIFGEGHGLLLIWSSSTNAHIATG